MPNLAVSSTSTKPYIKPACMGVKCPPRNSDIPRLERGIKYCTRTAKVAGTSLATHQLVQYITGFSLPWLQIACCSLAPASLLLAVIFSKSLHAQKKQLSEEHEKYLDGQREQENNIKQERKQKQSKQRKEEKKYRKEVALAKHSPKPLEKWQDLWTKHAQAIEQGQQHPRIFRTFPPT